MSVALRALLVLALGAGVSMHSSPLSAVAAEMAGCGEWICIVSEASCQEAAQITCAGFCPSAVWALCQEEGPWECEAPENKAIFCIPPA